MTSKAERKRNKVKARGSQYAGRPRVEGDRYPSGKLKPPKNDRLIEAKQAFVGAGLDIGLAEDPLDFLMAKRWLTPARYQTAIGYIQTRSRAGLGGAALSAAVVAETASTTGVAGRSFAEMSDAEITQVFDHVFRDPPSSTPEERQAAAFRKWQTMEAAMTPEQRREVQMICVQRSWTFWITDLNLGKDLVGKRLRQRQDFEAGLDAMRRALSHRVEAEQAISAAANVAPAPVAKVEERLHFVDEQGIPVQMMSAKGRPFEVSRKVRRH